MQVDKIDFGTRRARKVRLSKQKKLQIGKVVIPVLILINTEWDLVSRNAE